MNDQCRNLFARGLGVIVFFTTLFLTHAAVAQSVHGIFMVVKGDVTVISGQAADKTPQKAKMGSKVFPGDTIQAGKDSRAKIVMSDQNTLNISPDTKFQIEKYENDPGSDSRNVTLKVMEGKLRASVEQKYDGEKNKFNVKTPSAVAGVRGTDFLTSFSSATKTSQIITFHGTVAVGQPGPKGEIMNPVYVKPGQMTSASAGKAPEAPRAMPKEELSKMNNESKAETAASNQKQDSASTATEDKKEKKEDKDKEEKKDAKDKEKASDKKEAKDEKSADKKEAKEEKTAEKKEDRAADKKDDKTADKKDDRAREDKKSEPKKEANNANSDKAQGAERSPANAPSGGPGGGPAADAAAGMASGAAGGPGAAGGAAAAGGMTGAAGGMAGDAAGKAAGAGGGMMGPGGGGFGGPGGMMGGGMPSMISAGDLGPAVGNTVINTFMPPVAAMPNFNAINNQIVKPPIQNNLIDNMTQKSRLNISFQRCSTTNGVRTCSP